MKKNVTVYDPAQLEPGDVFKSVSNLGRFVHRFEVERDVLEVLPTRVGFYRGVGEFHQIDNPAILHLSDSGKWRWIGRVKGTSSPADLSEGSVRSYAPLTYIEVTK